MNIIPKQAVRSRIVKDPATAVRELCAELFQAPAQTIEVLRHPLLKPVAVHPHSHPDLIQFAFLRSCGGRVLSRDTWTGVSGRSALVAYPNDIHGYELRPTASDAEVTLIKLSITSDSIAHSTQPLPRLATTLPNMPDLDHALDRLHRDVTPTHTAMPKWIAEATLVLTCWPRIANQGSQEPYTTTIDQDADPAVQAALSLIESSLDAPPSLDDLAAAAHLSARQLSRRFQRAVGRTPHAYIAERRLARARALLFDDRLRAADIATALGFQSHAAFTRWFRQHEGRAPAEFRADPTRF